MNIAFLYLLLSTKFPWARMIRDASTGVETWLNTETCVETGVKKMVGSMMEHGGRTARQRWAEYGGYGLGWEASLDGTKYLRWGGNSGQWGGTFAEVDEGRHHELSSHLTQTMTSNLCVSLFRTFLAPSSSWYFTIMFIPNIKFHINYNDVSYNNGKCMHKVYLVNPSMKNDYIFTWVSVIS